MSEYMGGKRIDSLPVGTVVMWYGDPAGIPAGWHVCDGDDGTPNLRDTFPVVASSFAEGVPKSIVDTVDAKATGGSVVSSLVPQIDQLSAGSNVAAGADFSVQTVGHTHTLLTTEFSMADNTLPPFTAIYFIMKVA